LKNMNGQICQICGDDVGLAKTVGEEEATTTVTISGKIMYLSFKN
jgi:hypothetical protein